MRNLSISWKISGAIFITTVVCLITSSIFTLQHALNELELDIGKRLEHIAKTAALNLSKTDHDAIIQGYLSGDQEIANSPEFKRLNKYLSDVQKINNLETEIYTLIRADWAPGNMIFIAMGGKKVYIGNGLKANPTASQVFEEKTSAKTQIYNDSEGSWISAFAPLETDGEYPVLLEVDYKASTEVIAAKQEVALNLIFPLLLSLCISLFIGYILAKTLSRPILQLRDVAQEISSGNMNVRSELTQKDELGQLSQAFDHMIVDIKEKRKQIEAERDRANQASKAKSQFLANMSHEIRTPLNGIIGFLSVLDTTDLSGQQRNYLKTMAHSGDMLLTIINDILEFSRIEAGHLEIVKKKINIRKTIESVVDVLALKAFQKGLEISSFCESEITELIKSDEGRIRQVIMNIMGNAVKFTHYGEVYVQVSLKHEKLLFEIIDTGIGIPKNKQASIFGAFSQTDDSDTRKYGGTGLGLTISKRIVEEMGGEIGLESKESQGTRFYFTIPYHPVSNKSQQQIPQKTQVTLLGKNSKILSHHGKRIQYWGGQAHRFMNKNKNFEKTLNHSTHFLVDKDFLMQLSEKQRQELEIQLQGKSVGITCKVGMNSGEGLLNCKAISLFKPVKEHDLFKWVTGELEKEQKNKTTKNYNFKKGNRILIVDDNETNRSLFHTILKKHGFECLLAKNGQEASDQFRNKGPFDLILMDLQMPIKDGFTATKEIRALPDGAQTPIVAITAHSVRNAQERCRQVGMDGFLTKPIKENALLEEVHKHITPTTNEKKKNAKILLVEDNSINQQLAQVLLTTGGYECEIASNGQIGVNMFRDQGPFDLILMDCQMPVMDGFDATRAIRKLENGQNVPIVAMTANVFDSVKKECLEAGMDDFISKPVKNILLYEIIKKNLNKKIKAA